MKRCSGKATIMGLLTLMLLLVPALAACATGKAGANAPSTTALPPTSRIPTSAPTASATSPASTAPAATPGPAALAQTSPLAPTPAPPPPKPSGPVKSTVIDVSISGDTVSIPVNKVNQYTNTRFKMDTPQGSEMFMVYSYEGKTYVRASICPPCRSQSFALTKGTLVCDSCGTVFDAVTGKGISGACVAYPKQSTQYQVNGDSLTVSKADLIAAYQKTLNQGK